MSKTMISMSVNLREFRAQIRAVVVATGKESASVLNKNAVKVLIGAKGIKGAVHLTPKVTKGQIRRDLNKKYRTGGKSVKLLWILASKKLKKEGIGKGMKPDQWRELVASAAERIAGARDQSRAYLAAGWLNCLPGLGHHSKAARGVKVYPGRKASKSYAIGATPGKLSMVAYNAAAEPGTRAGQIIEAALNGAIANATADMKQYLHDRVEAAANGITLGRSPKALR